MKALAVVGTAGGTGTTTLAALAFAALRHDAYGAPRLLGAPGGGLVERVGSAEVARLDPTIAVWDAGVQTPAATVELLRSGEATVVLAAPATPLGRADVEQLLARVAEAGEALLGRLAVVHSEVHGRDRPGPEPAVRVAFRLLVPFDAALARPGALPATDRLGRARAAVGQWQRWCAQVLRN